MNNTKLNNIKLIIDKLEILNKQNSKKKLIYLIPKLWLVGLDNNEISKFEINNPFSDKNLNTNIKNKYTSLKIENVINVNPYQYFITILNKILNENDNNNVRVEGIRVYNVFNRYFSAFDHNNDGELKTNINQFDDTIPAKKSKKNNTLKYNEIAFYDIEGNEIVFEYPELNELGTFLKTTCLLYYIKSLNINTLYFLPIFENGDFGKKGNLGSPYAVKNYFNLDKNQIETKLDLEPEIEFSALIEAAKKLGFKVILEFVFRITSLDNDWALENPEWFYWIKANTKMREKDDLSEAKYGSPIYLKRELKEIKEKVENSDFNNSIPPHETYRNLFTPVPKKVARVEGKMLGLYENNKECTIASAFADWPPDDNQPAWKDVAYLRLYEDVKFNYVAYNTIRMYDNALAQEKNEVTPLWNILSSIIPHYIYKYDIDGAMIDMGHALPIKLRNQIIAKARELKSDFMFWEENFGISAKSKEEGYDATLGYFFLDSHINYKIKEIIWKVCNNEFEQNFLLTSENHNTLRSSWRFENEFEYNGKNENNHLYSKLIYTLIQFLPQIKFIYNGFELAESLPTNTGLGFNDEQLEEFAHFDLPLFNAEKLPWDMVNFKSNSEINVDDYNRLNFETYSKLSIYEFIVNVNANLSKFQIELGEIVEHRTLNNYFDYSNSLIYIENIFSTIIENQNKFSKLIFIANFGLEKVVYEFETSKILFVYEDNALSNINVLVGNDNDIINESNDYKISIELNPFEFYVLVVE